MSKIVILTETNCDLTPDLAKELDIETLPMTVVFADKEYNHNIDQKELTNKDFYDGMRQGKTASTVAVNPTAWAEAAKVHLQQGDEVLILAFSSGLSATYNSAVIAMGDLKEEFPNGKIAVVDTLCASMGQGLLCHYASKKRESGATLEELADYAQTQKMKIAHWFTVDDLQYLKRGGRISPTAATVGTMLQIKPVMHVDDEGHLVPVSKVRGRKGALNAMVTEMCKSVANVGDQPIFISHGDCLDDVVHLQEQITLKLGLKEFYVNSIGPSIGAHSGPGTVALFFVGNNR